MRQMKKGRAAGSSRMRCRFPVSVNFAPPIRSSTSSDPWSGRFQTRAGFRHPPPAHVRIKVHGDQQDVLATGAGLLEKQDVVVEGGKQRQPQMGMQRGFSFRRRFRSAISPLILPGRSQSQARISYFSESAYSLRLASGRPSQSSKTL